jgi:hypothetical protein
MEKPKMKARGTLQTASFIFLVVAVSCIFLVLRLPQSGVRIPVHCANGKIGFIDQGGRMVIAPVWDSATPFGKDHRALVSITKKPGTIETFLLRWTLRSFIFPRTLHYKVDRQGNLTAVDPHRFDPLRIETKPIDSGEITLVEQSAQFRWILKDGSPAFSGSWQQAKDFKGEDPAAVLENRRWGLSIAKERKLFLVAGMIHLDSMEMALPVC